VVPVKGLIRPAPHLRINADNHARHANQRSIRDDPSAVTRRRRHPLGHGHSDRVATLDLE
jgi:hypothetical protein